MRRPPRAGAYHVVPPGDKNESAGHGFAMVRPTGLRPSGLRRDRASMSDQTPTSGVPSRLTSGRYLALVDEGVLGRDDSRRAARRDVPEYWIVSRRGDHIVVAARPLVRNRRYAVLRVARRGESITLAAFPHVTVAVDDLLPPADESLG